MTRKQQYHSNSPRRYSTLLQTHFFYAITILLSLSSLPATTSTEPKDTENTNENNNDLFTQSEISKLRKTIAQGHVYIHPNFLSEPQIQSLLQDFDDLNQQEGYCTKSGLSDTSKGLGTTETQNFGEKDRTVCPVPWWKESLSDTTQKEENKESYFNNKPLLQSTSTQIQNLRTTLSTLLPTRPTLSNSFLAHECYYSTSTYNASLSRHIDEFHEEFKGARGWLLPSRRSLSWLIYLSDEDWNKEDGGELRYYYQNGFENVAVEMGVWEVGCHDGNLQVAWLKSETEIEEEEGRVVPVYLDSWFMYPSSSTVVEIDSSGDQEEQMMEPHCILYIIDHVIQEEQSETLVGQKKFITRPWPCDATNGYIMSDFLATTAQLEASSSSSPPKLFLETIYAQNFYLIEDRKSWMQGLIPYNSKYKDVIPKRGTLVIFDSVSVPHEITR